MNPEARALAEPAEGSAGARHVARRILVATVLGFAMLVVLGGRSRADVLEPAQAVAESSADAVGQTAESAADAVGQTAESAADAVGQTAEGATDAVGQAAQTANDTASETLSSVVDAANETVQPIVQTTTDVVEPVAGTVTDVLPPVHEAAETVLPDPKGVVPQDPSNPQPPISGVKLPNAGTLPASRSDPSRSSAGWVARTADIASAATAPPSSSIVHPGRNPRAAPPSGGSHGHGGGSPFEPLGRGAAHEPLPLLVLFAAIAASLIVRPPPIRSLLAPSVVAPNGAALALSVERPG